MKKKLLVYNIMEYPEKIRLFNRGIADVLDGMEMDADFYVFGESDKLPDYNDYSHLIISGSEASAMDESPWTNELTDLILNFVKAGKKILAICYGHQFLVRALLGKEHVFKLPVPEYGYSKINLKQNKLFHGISEPVVLELHYDAVRNLPPEFEIIAENKKAIQAYRYKGMDVYGVQFHPEFNRIAAQYFFEETRESDLDFPDFFHVEPADDHTLKQNSLFIRNFLEM
jgi:GMP synthase (glutamine-hydrolysing)